jgi:hypothetical protein
MKIFKNILLYLLVLLLVLAGALDFFGLEPVKSEMEALNLGGYKMIIVGLLDWLLAIGIVIKRTRPVALDAVLFLAFGSIVAHLVIDAGLADFGVPFILLLLAFVNIHLNYKIKFINK